MPTTMVPPMTAPMSAAATKSHATRENPGRAISDVLMLAAAIASLAAVGQLLVEASSATGAMQELLAGLGVASVALSWFAVHTLFMLRYAMLYYSGVEGGIGFNQTLPPRYLDFAYLAITVGMTFQVSDTDISKAAIRMTVLRHVGVVTDGQAAEDADARTAGAQAIVGVAGSI